MQCLQSNTAFVVLLACANIDMEQKVALSDSWALLTRIEEQ
jgi:hypothetical protein